MPFCTGLLSSHELNGLSQSEVARRIAEAGGSEFTEYATLFDKLVPSTTPPAQKWASVYGCS